MQKDDYNGQDEFIVELKRLFKRLKHPHCTLIAHSRFKDGGSYRIPMEDDIEGSKGLIKPVHNSLCIWRNTPKEDAKNDPDSVVDRFGNPDPEKVERLLKQPDAYLLCYKQRQGHRRRFKEGLWFNFKSRRFRTKQFDRSEDPVPTIPDDAQAMLPVEAG